MPARQRGAHHAGHTGALLPEGSCWSHQALPVDASAPCRTPKKPSAVQVSRSAHSPQKAPLPCPDRTRPDLQPSTGGREIWVETQNRNKNGLRLTCCCKALPPRYLMGAGNEAGRAPGSYNQKRPRTTCCGPAAAPGAPHSLASPAVLPEDTAPPSASSALAPSRGSAVPPPRGVSARLLSRARRLWVFFEGSSYPDRSQIPGCAAVGGCTASPRQAASPARGHPGPPRNNSIIFGCPKLSWRFEPRGTNPTEPTPWAFRLRFGRCFACFKSRRFQALQRTMETFCWRQKAASHLRVPWLTHSLGTKTHIPRSPSLCKGITGLPRSSAHQETQSHFRKPFGINLMQTTPSARRRNAGLSMAPPEPQHHPAPGTYRSLPPSSSRLPKRRVPRG